MEVEFLRTFSNDLRQIQDPALLRRIEQVINEVKSARSPREIRNLKKLEGEDEAFRVRIGDYRIGFYLNKGVVLFAHVASRRDIYRSFP